MRPGQSQVRVILRTQAKKECWFRNNLTEQEGYPGFGNEGRPLLLQFVFSCFWMERLMGDNDKESEDGRSSKHVKIGIMYPEYQKT